LARLRDVHPSPLNLQVAETCVGTRALGPGLRSVAWVQGCPFHCQGCIAAELLAHPGVTGFTFSGGEPMAQAAGLAETIRVARRQRDLTLICFTGYRLTELRDRPPGPGVAELLAQTDVLIDGRYVASRNDGLGMRGSSNQHVHMLTGRLAHAAAELGGGPRRTEIRLRGRSALLVGVPGRETAEAFDRVSALAGARHKE
jgi:anaerobic ribonucleoside-triphosphate reductase activating protein